MDDGEGYNHVTVLSVTGLDTCMVKIVCFILYDFYHNKKKLFKKL